MLSSNHIKGLCLKMKNNSKINGSVKYGIINGVEVHGLRVQDIKRYMGLSEGTVFSWLQKYRDGRVTKEEIFPIPEHQHFFTVDTPNGRTSRGVCIKCCEVKHYFNSIDMLNINRRSGGRGISLGGSKSPIT